MKLLNSILVSFVVLAFSCNKAKICESEWVNAVVANTRDINCGFPLLNFSEDSVKVASITGEPNQVYFIGKDFPAALNISGKRVSLLIRKLKPEESFPCLTLGFNYPAIKILDARER